MQGDHRKTLQFAANCKRLSSSDLLMLRKRCNCCICVII